MNLVQKLARRVPHVPIVALCAALALGACESAGGPPLSDMAGISNPYLSQIERGLRKPSAEILQQIAKALRISAETLYVRAGILEQRDPDAGLEEAIDRDPTLTDHQKQALLEVYRSFQREATPDAPNTQTPESTQ